MWNILYKSNRNDGISHKNSSAKKTKQNKLILTSNWARRNQGSLKIKKLVN